jgi:hypothetical protein
MASTKQIAANRANAKRSTGPNTKRGRLQSSRNAFQHGLSGPLNMDEATLSTIEAIARLLLDKFDRGQESLAAKQFAETQLELLRVRCVRNELMISLSAQPYSLGRLKQMLSLDRYERCALSKRKKATQELQRACREDNKTTSVG